MPWGSIPTPEEARAQQAAQIKRRAEKYAQRAQERAWWTAMFRWPAELCKGAPRL